LKKKEAYVIIPRVSLTKGAHVRPDGGGIEEAARTQCRGWGEGRGCRSSPATVCRPRGVSSPGCAPLPCREGRGREGEEEEEEVERKKAGEE
jgi:hypothetical protein